MNNISPSKPSFVFGYWRPWKENSNVFDSYLNYNRDISLIKYGADTIGNYINQASKEQIDAINKLGKDIGYGLNILSNQMDNINENLVFLNRNIDIQIEQQKLSNLLLQNIAELLRIPDSEKERQHSIELGIKFFVNASKDSDLFADALDEFIKAESYMKQDFFVLHRLGCIYMHVEKFLNPEKALDYFIRAAKYASVESDPNSIRLANVLTNNFNTVNTEINNSTNLIGKLASESYEKAAFAAYVLGYFEDAINYQKKALFFDLTPQNKFLLAKYQIRFGELEEGIINLERSIMEEATFSIAIFKELDLLNEPVVIELMLSKNKLINSKINELAENWKSIKSSETNNIIFELNELVKKPYHLKVEVYKKYEDKLNYILSNFPLLIDKIDILIEEIKSSNFLTINSSKIDEIIYELKLSKNLNFEELQITFEKIEIEIANDRLKIGAKYAGGIIFYLDETGNHGLVVADKDFGEAQWSNNGINCKGCYQKIDANNNGINDGSGLKNTKKILEFASWECEKSFFSSKIKPYPTAARICLESNYNGFDDWYLPTISELKLVCNCNSIVEMLQLNNGYLLSSTEKDHEKVIGLFLIGRDNDKFIFKEIDIDKAGKNIFVAIRVF